MSITVSDEHLREVEEERNLYREAFEAADNVISVFEKNGWNLVPWNEARKRLIAAKKKLEGMK